MRVVRVVPAAAVVRLRRAKPWLGTLVEITAGADPGVDLQAAIDAAYAEIALVHRLMSPQEPESDVARLNAARLGAAVRVDIRTAEVLHAAAALFDDSDGAFDCTAGSAEGAVVVGRHGAPHPGWQLDATQCCQRTADGRVDLGGIAKGYAVDRALAVLLAWGVREALVNAGGDLAHHGQTPVQVRLRDPADPGRCAAVVSLCNGAIASSASSASSATWASSASRSAVGADARFGSVVVDMRTQRVLAAGAGVSVAAPKCLWADALTKVVLVTGNVEHPTLARHGARVLHYRGVDDGGSPIGGLASSGAATGTATKAGR